MKRKVKLPLIILAVIGLISAGLGTELAILVAMFVAAVGVLALAFATLKKVFSFLLPS
ncbi:hypothetical protein [Vibrio genomosp. F10]|uniref:hypothetical protein n=1 Tax=Vibrio genomosp. F10 TaxID=723171 RepID=UPI000319CBA6|nr:hypothetical protein [Vibrio genomosp. F10]